MDATNMVKGHSTIDALRILHNELQQQLCQHQNQTKVAVDWVRFLHHDSAYSLLHWTSILFVVISSFTFIIAYVVDIYRVNWLVIESLILLLLLVLNLYFVVWDDRLRRTELISKASRILAKIEACIKESVWSPLNYIDLNCPLSQCVSLQWTIRDTSVINLPVGLLVEGDVILLRPGQVVPAKCRRMKTGYYEEDQQNVVEYEAGDFYNPAENLPEIELFSKIEAREPLKPQAFVVLETPFVKNFKMILEQSLSRPVGMLDNERFTAYSIWIERRIIPVIAFLMVLTNALRYSFLQDDVGSWSEMILVLTVNSIVPLLALPFPVFWRLLDAWGIAKVFLTYEETVHCRDDKKQIPSGGSFKNDATLEGNIELKLAWKDLIKVWSEVLAGHSSVLPRTANLVQVLGNMTSFCCVDKKGVLSWPNPTAEKVFILTSKQSHPFHQRMRNHSEKSKSPEQELQSSEGHKDSSCNKNDPNNKGFPAEVSFQVLDLTQDKKNHYGLRFDDPSWSKYLNSLKPLGLNILLNTCNMETTYKYTEFADHVTCVSLKREEAVPVVNRRCFCELAHQIGFSEKAHSNFTTQQTFGMYRHIPPESTSSERKLESSKSFIKYKMPMPNIFSVVVRDNYTGTRHLFSQGMADLLLDACTDFWDGHNLQPLGDAERKVIADFYHRKSMSSYCTAFSYRPLTDFVGNEFNDVYLEVPEDVAAFLGPLANRSYGTSDSDKRRLVNERPYHGSAESLLHDDQVANIHDVDGCFQSQCNQVFIGMITMQYQAKQDVVDLIESLESAFIRFVHFSKENELRSRGFSEKMGLEAGWNCHISLASEKHSEQKVDSTDVVNGNQNSSIGYESEMVSPTLDDIDPADVGTSQSDMHPKWLRNGRFGSAPEIAMTPAPCVKSPATPERVLKLSQEISNAVLPESCIEGRENEPLPLATTPLLRNVPGKASVESVLPWKRNLSERAAQEQRQTSAGLHMMTGVSKSESKSSLHRTRKRSSTDKHMYIAEQLQDKVTIVVDDDIGREMEELLQGNTYADMPSDTCVRSRASSCSDSLGFVNRAKLPRGIENIRPHINNIDNVPLQVSLFTDCTAQTTQEMLCILQEYGEVTCCIGSSANFENTNVFLQSDCSLAVEPTYPQICIHHSVIEKPSLPAGLAPMELCAELYSLPCSLYFASCDQSVIIQLVAVARHHCQRVRSVCKLYLACQMSISLLQLLNSFVLLPPALPSTVILWLAVVVIPLLSFTLMGNPLNQKVLQMAQGKNRTHFTKQTLVEEMAYFLIRYLPTLAVSLFCHSLNLLTFCQHRILPLTNVTTSCHWTFGNRTSGELWNSWYSEHQSGLILSQQIVTFQLVLYLVMISFCSIHRLSYLWEKSPFRNRLWCIIIPIIIILQLVFFVANTSYANQNADIVYSLSDVPVAVWVIAFIWLLLLILLHELVKRREIKMWVRHQKRARLDFGTKLGMNSPF